MRPGSRVMINQVPRTLRDLIDEDAISLDAGRTATLLLGVCAHRALRSEGIGAGEKRLQVVDSYEREGRLP
jgi:hypothetical protein